MILLPMAVPFVVVVLAALVAMLGLRRTSMWLWLVAVAASVYAFPAYITTPLRIAL